MKFSIKNMNTEPFFDSLKLYTDEYLGAYNRRCHEGAINFGYSNTVVTAFMHEPQSELMFLHSFVENEERVLETTANIP